MYDTAKSWFPMIYPLDVVPKSLALGTERSQLISHVLADHGPGAVPTEVRFWLRALDRRQGL
jgi:hypothetical protein